jgi:hypothetical protein
MSNFFDALKKASEDAGVPTPTVPVSKPAPAPKDPAPKPAEADAQDAPQESDGLLDAADAVCITPDGWYATEVYDDLADEEH